MSKYKVDLFEALNKINIGDIDWFDNLTEEEVKSLSPYIMLLWIKGAQKNNLAHIIMTNEYSNPFIFNLDKNHRKLLYKLLCYSNNFNDKTRYNFRKSDKKQININAISWYYQENREKSKEIFHLLSEKDMSEILDLYNQTK